MFRPKCLLDCVSSLCVAFLYISVIINKNDAILL